MSAGQELFRRWISEYCAPVVVTTASAEAEKICLKNGLLLHELLSCFGHLDGINSTIRVPGQNFPMPDAHVRFERVTEVKMKSTDNIEQMLSSKFTPFDMNRLPSSVAELKLSPPTAWTSETEQIVLRSLSFSEFEMMSHPVVILTAVSTSDIDPVAAMLELASVHHTPPCFTNGQYEPLVQRVYVLLDDVGEKSKEPFTVLRALHSRFPPSSTKLIPINSFSASAPNLQQPDMWSKFSIPKYFGQHAPQVEEDEVAKDPRTNKIVLGSRLSVDDFMKLREFCIWLFNEQIVPSLEKRLTVLSKLVNDARRGVKNVLSRFWRKPREETDSPKGGVKYRHDKIETQTLLLADTSFIVRDYETASTMYKLVRDDYKSDKSILHLAYSLLMIAVCQLITEPHKYKEIQGHLDSVSQCLIPSLELVHGNAMLGLLCAELYVASSHGRAPLESARILLLAAHNVNRYPIMSGLLIERAALFWLQAYQTKRYIFLSIVAGNKLQKCGYKPARHAMTCFTAAMMLLEKGHWGDMKNKLCKTLAQDLKSGQLENKQRGLMLLLRTLASFVNGQQDVTDQNGMIEAVAVLNEISRDGGWGNVVVNEGWSQCPVRDFLLGPLPIGLVEDSGGLGGKSHVEVCGLSVPEIDMSSIEILEPINGFDEKMLHTATPELLQEMEMMKELLSVERDIMGRKQVASHEQECILAREWAQITRKYKVLGGAKNKSDVIQKKKTIPLGEKLWCKMKMTNKLPVDLNLAHLRMGIDRSDRFTLQSISASINAEESSEVLLKAEPKELGIYNLMNMQWKLSETLSIKQNLQSQGQLLQKTLKQRANRERAEDKRFQFEVVPAAPLLRMNLDGLSADGLQGQLIRTRLRMINEGAAAAQQIFLKCSHPCFLFYYIGKENEPGCDQMPPIEFFGYSSTVIELKDSVIEPSKDLVLDVWLRMSNAGTQFLSLLAQYSSANSNLRYSFTSVQMQGLPCAKLSVQLLPKLSSSTDYTLIMELTNLFKQQAHRNNSLPRASSVLHNEGRPDMLERHAEVDEQCAKIVALRLLGAGNKSNMKYLQRTNDKDDTEYLTSPGERVAECFPITFRIPPQDSVGLSTWLLPFDSAEGTEFEKATQCAACLLDLCNRFQCLWYCVSVFSELVMDAKMAIELEEVEADVMGPRSIQEVRREREQQLKGGDLNASQSSSIGNGISRKFVSDVQAIADYEAQRNSMSVVALWVCRWKNRLRWGFQHMPRVGYAFALTHAHDHKSFTDHSQQITQKLATLSPSPSSSVAKIMTKALTLANSVGVTGNILSALQCSIHHATEIVLDIDEVKSLSVVLSIRSFVDEDVVLQVRSTSVQASSKPNDVVSTGTNKGVLYTSQVVYNNVQLKANDMISFKFHALVMSKGVHNMNRFQVSASSKEEPSNSSENNFHDLHGQSLLFVE